MFAFTSLTRFLSFLVETLNIYIYINLLYTRSHQLAIDLRSQHVPLPMDTPPLAAIAVVSRPYEVIATTPLPCIDH